MSDISEIEAEVLTETAACIARVAMLIERAREAGAPVQATVKRDFADSIQDAAFDVVGALKAATVKMEDARAEEQMPTTMAQARRDYIAYRR
ncbi:hypothetical protein [Xanthobacter versatilis]|uniref:hypothetical protein n=1 Tax=Xanthobacter autotrophicus (strain ATCC BAA-1158 / Py2) TaxID=78245 RepID=UPI00372A71DD